MLENRNNFYEADKFNEMCKCRHLGCIVGKKLVYKY